MIRAMVFVHGTWLHAHTPRLGRLYGKPDFQIDFRRLPGLLTEELCRREELGPIDVVRSYYFGSYAENYDMRDHHAVQRRHAFFNELRAEGRFQVEAFGVDYQGRRLRRQDRPAGDDYTPAERCVDVALSVGVMRYAMTPSALDLALLVIGDADFVPLLQEIRRLGKRAAVVSIDGACADVLAHVGDALGVRDFDVLWLNDLLNQIEKWRARPLRHEAEREPTDGGAAAGTVLRGRIRTVIRERGYGFIAAEDGLDYFFHANALGPELDFATLEVDERVKFEVRGGPNAGRAGAARLVQPAGDPDQVADAWEPIAGAAADMAGGVPGEEAGDDADVGPDAPADEDVPDPEGVGEEPEEPR